MRSPARAILPFKEAFGHDHRSVDCFAGTYRYDHWACGEEGVLTDESEKGCC